MIAGRRARAEIRAGARRERRSEREGKMGRAAMRTARWRKRARLFPQAAARRLDGLNARLLERGNAETRRCESPQTRHSPGIPRALPEHAASAAPRARGGMHAPPTARSARDSRPRGGTRKRRGSNRKTRRRQNLLEHDERADAKMRERHRRDIRRAFPARCPSMRHRPRRARVAACMRRRRRVRRAIRVRGAARESGAAQIGKLVVDRISLSTTNVRICRTPGRYSNCSACSRLNVSLSRVRISMM
ncbi:Uncharacterised protein [Burkholderia pseudomallei]|nr:Uncharacterised protein [Burkholderia pseudomallei]